MLRLEPLELVQQPIEGFVGDLGFVLEVVTLFVMSDLPREAERCARGGSIESSVLEVATLGGFRDKGVVRLAAVIERTAHP